MPDSQKETNRSRTSSGKEYHEPKNELAKELGDLLIDIQRMHRQFIYAFGVILVSILSVLAVDIYFHI